MRIVIAAAPRNSTLKNVLKPSIASRPLAMVRLSPTAADTAEPAATSTASESHIRKRSAADGVSPAGAAAAPRIISTSARSTSSAPIVRTTSGSR
jgi:hypothetical protein